MLWNQHMGSFFVGPTFEGLWINQKGGGENTGVKYMMPCSDILNYKFYLLFRGILTLQRKLQTSVAIHGISWKLQQK